ncbi:MAG: D-glycero-beta-D-manno-heptose 1,7-bisphosphate 7-phosphatase [Candidatus Margulisbacteria bacterium]|jgi:D-glycero-D-manno-heptose 1,7-bisphosphate phosphatase|nr:D-glycero-beta-D-manno-heptose 1,7-bisphosphate 7-phosphatase [Candidatus Margulisiibacteriota bacterium]
MQGNRAVFVDRDGTIIEDTGYISSPQEVRFIPGSIAALKRLNQAGFKVIVITNQSGVARGYFSENMLQSVDKAIHRQVLNGGAHIDAFYYCPHHPDHGVYPYRQECACRKPHPGMILKGAREHQVDLSHSFMIGDHRCDVAAGKNAGVKTVFVTTGHGSQEQNKLPAPPDRIVPDLAAAVDWILQEAS